MKNKSPSSSEGALTSLRLDLPLHKKFSPNSIEENGSESSSSSTSSSSSSSGSHSVDTFLSHLGDPGRFQVVIMILLATNCIPVVVNHLLMAFYAVKTPHNCRISSELSNEHFYNQSRYLPVKNADAKPGGKVEYADCEMYVDVENVADNDTQSCVHGYEFHFSSANEWNVISEWGLVCEREWIGPTVTTVYFCGVMIGGIVFGSLSDRFGRKNMMLICLYTQCLIGIVIHFVRRLIVFIALRFVQGIFIQGLQCVTYSMVMELFSPRYRTMAGCTIEAFWALGIILLAAIAKFVRHWRYIQLAVNIPTAATIFYIWIIPESVRWLISKGKLKRAEEIVVKIASYNSLRFERSWLRSELLAVGNQLRENNNKTRGDLPLDGNELNEPQRQQESGVKDILKNEHLRKNSFVLFYVWFSVALAYYGISFSIPNLSGDRYLNFMIGGGVEMGAYLLAFVVLDGFGRKFTLSVYLLLSGALCISAIAVKDYDLVFFPDLLDKDKLAIALALLGKAAVVSCFCTIFIYSSELFPTVIRTFGVGACAFFGRVGSLTAPQILLLGQRLYPDSPELVTFLTFGVLCLVAGMLSLMLPETLNKALPDTVKQADRIGTVREDDPMMTAGETETHHWQSRKKSHGSIVSRRKLSSKRRKSSKMEEECPDEVGYGKSPEWVEVDGMIVSKGIFNSMDRRKNSPGGHMTTVNMNSNAAAAAGDTGQGSLLSIPYSNRTQMTSAAQSGPGYDILPPVTSEDDEEEPPYETLPSIQFTDDGSKTSSTLNKVEDDSVISAHHSGLYDYIKEENLNTLKSRILLSEDLGDETRL